ncbi:hypothetical protein DFH09DRAFT_1110976 [Mycena vulgaris]|nr:hypothetical protein DFH09DRAFT_1110976 [Mycena vulgaris]
MDPRLALALNSFALQGLYPPRSPTSGHSLVSAPESAGWDSRLVSAKRPQTGSGNPVKVECATQGASYDGYKVKFRSFEKSGLSVRIRAEDVTADALKSGDGCRGSCLDARERRRRIWSGMKISALQEGNGELTWRDCAMSEGKWGWIGTSMARILGAHMFKPHSDSEERKKMINRIDQAVLAIASEPRPSTMEDEWKRG